MTRLERMEAKLDQLMVDVAVLKERDRRRGMFWGALSGGIVTLLVEFAVRAT